MINTIDSVDIFIFAVHDILLKTGISEDATQSLVSETIALCFHQNLGVFAERTSPMMAYCSLEQVIQINAIVESMMPHSLLRLNAFIESCDDALVDLSTHDKMPTPEMNVEETIYLLEVSIQQEKGMQDHDPVTER